MRNRRRITGADSDDEFASETLARLATEAEERHRPAGEAWLTFQRRHPRRRWRPLLETHVLALRLHYGLPSPAGPGVDEPLAIAITIAEAVATTEVQEQPAYVNEEPRRRRCRSGYTDRSVWQLNAQLIRAQTKSTG